MRCVVGALLYASLLVFFSGRCAAEKSIDYSVQVTASIEESPARITLHWAPDSCCNPESYTVSRKSVTDSAWGKSVVLPGAASEFVDHNITIGARYEYQVVKTTPKYNGYGYICAGIKAPLVDQRGRILLVVDNTYAADLAAELARLEEDLVGDGWLVSRFDVARTDSVLSVKERIKARYYQDPTQTKALFLLGHVPVPYSGDIVPDGHAPDHQGAWPCDGFYGDMEGVWSDNIVSDTRATDPRNRNVPGDGKYDQSTFPAPIKLMVGRVDLSKMPGRLSFAGEPTFPSELELLRNYLNKDHEFRQKQFDLPRRGVVGDYFGVRDGEAFAASGWRNLSGFFSPDSVSTIGEEGLWIPSLTTNAFLCAYGCGPGSYTSIGGLGNSDKYHDGVTTELYRHDAKAVFTMLFGSWLGDWDSEDNFQRAALALPSYGLTCVCSGRPHWFMHHMAMGDPIGYSTRLTQNNGPNGLYRNQQNNCAQSIHIALMGDPTLRLHTVAPPSSLTCATGDHASLTWEPSSDEVVGYNVYRAKNPGGPYSRITSRPVTVTALLDNTGSVGDSYMVRAVKLEKTPTGSYYNASEGVFFYGGTSQIASGSTKLPVTPDARLRAASEHVANAQITPTGASTNGLAPANSAGSGGGQ